MENATDALKMAFAVFVFVMALTIAITMFSQLNQVSKIVLASSDITTFYEYIPAGNDDAQSRIVGLETIIPTLYKYYKENYTVLFLNKDGNPLPLYETQTEKKLWGSGVDETGKNPDAGIIGKYYNSDDDNKPVCAFDVDDETIRHEPWTGTSTDFKENLDAFLYGKEFYYPSGEKDEDGNVRFYDYTEIYRNGFINRFSGTKFKETLGEYTYNLIEETEEDTINNELLKNRKKRVIIYQIVE